MDPLDQMVGTVVMERLVLLDLEENLDRWVPRVIEETPVALVPLVLPAPQVLPVIPALPVLLLHLLALFHLLAIRLVL